MGRGSRTDQHAVAVSARNEDIRGLLGARRQKAAAPGWEDAVAPDAAPRTPARLDTPEATERLARLEAAGGVERAITSLRELDKMRNHPKASGLLRDIAGHIADLVADEQRPFRERLCRALGIPHVEPRWDAYHDRLYGELRNARRRLTLEKARAKALPEHDATFSWDIDNPNPSVGSPLPDVLDRWFTPTEREQIEQRRIELGLDHIYVSFRFPVEALIARCRSGYRPPSQPFDPTLKTVLEKLVEQDTQRLVEMYTKRSGRALAELVDLGDPK